MKNIIFLILILILCSCRSSSSLKIKSTLDIDSIGKSMSTIDIKKDSTSSIFDTGSLDLEYTIENYIPTTDSIGNITGSVLASRKSVKLAKSSNKKQMTKISTSQNNETKQSSSVKKKSDVKLNNEKKSETSGIFNLIDIIIIILSLILVFFIKKKWTSIWSFIKNRFFI